MENKRRNLTEYATTYSQLRPFWIDCLNLKEPLPGTLTQYLCKYTKEDDIEFSERVKRLAQLNLVDIISDIYLSMLFSTTVQIDSENHQDEVDAFVANCNAQGDDLVDWFREVVGPNALTYGVCDVFVDLPSAKGEIASLDQQRQAGVDQPYCYVVPPLNRINWTLDDAKNYVEYRSVDVIDTQLSAGMKPTDNKQYTVWTLDKVTKYKGDEPEETVNPYGLIPAVTVIPLPSIRFYSDRIGISLVQDIVPLQKLVLNLISLILDFHENVNFATRVLIQDTEMGQNEPPTEGELSEGGNKRGIILKGGDSDYKLVTPDAGGVESMRAFLCEIIERIYQCALLPSDSNTNKTHQTGTTIRTNQAQLFNRLTRMTKHLSKSMKQVVEMALRVRGIDPVEAGVTVRWDNNFSYEAFINAIEQLTQLKETVGDMSPTAVREYAKNVIGPQLYNSGKLETIYAELEQWTGVVPQTEEKPPTLQKQNTEINAAEKVEVSE